MGRFLARNLFQQEHREREPIAPQRRFEAIAGGKLLDANREIETSKLNMKIAHHISEKRHESSSGCKGLRIKHEGRWDQMWMVKWFEWYKYVVAFTRKVFDFSVSCAKGIGETLRAENAKTAWSS